MVAYAPAFVDISVQQHNTIYTCVVTINDEQEAVNCMLSILSYYNYHSGVLTH